ncbi:unnamed protein product [Bathycoccus prasinos]
MSKVYKPTAVLVIGMAGSGKTTLLQQLNSKCHENAVPDYLINLDPAVKSIPYEANIDIRDTINYKNIMAKFNLGPNGAILTASNLFATRFDQVLNLCKNRSKQLKYIFIDTPDVASAHRIKSWLGDFETFQKVVEESGTFSSDLNLYTSSLTGEGIGDLFAAIDSVTT